MAHSYLGSAPRRQNNSGLVESKQGKFSVVGAGFALVFVCKRGDGDGGPGKGQTAESKVIAGGLEDNV